MKYRVNYASESRGEFVAVETMHEVHLVNAYVKACEGRSDADSETLTALADEIRSQGLITAYKGGAPILRVVADVRVVYDHDYNERFLAEIEDVCRKFARPYRDGRMQAVVSVESAGFVNAYDSPAPTLKVALPKVKAVKTLVGAAS